MRERLVFGREGTYFFPDAVSLGVDVRTFDIVAIGLGTFLDVSSLKLLRIIKSGLHFNCCCEQEVNYFPILCALY